jgi:hypothetical protein
MTTISQFTAQDGGKVTVCAFGHRTIASVASPDTFKVSMTSEVYGEEVFEYDSRRDQERGYKRLLKSARLHFQQDGIERIVTKH